MMKIGNATKKFMPTLKTVTTSIKTVIFNDVYRSGAINRNDCIIDYISLSRSVALKIGTIRVVLSNLRCLTVSNVHEDHHCPHTSKCNMLRVARSPIITRYCPSTSDYII